MFITGRHHSYKRVETKKKRTSNSHKIATKPMIKSQTHYDSCKHRSCHDANSQCVHTSRACFRVCVTKLERCTYKILKWIPPSSARTQCVRICGLSLTSKWHLRRVPVDVQLPPKIPHVKGARYETSYYVQNSLELTVQTRDGI